MLEQALDWRSTSRFSGDEFVGTMTADVTVKPSASSEVLQRASAEIERFCEPCKPGFAGQRLAELRVLTVHRARDDVDMELLAQAYTSRLAEYPADVVAAATKAWSDREQFWPSWAELKAECDKRMRGRLQAREALRRFR